jgi:hypothetical protein
MELITIAALAASHIVAAALGAAGYRYYLKRDPAKLEAWAQALKVAGKQIEEKVKE